MPLSTFMFFVPARPFGWTGLLLVAMTLPGQVGVRQPNHMSASLQHHDHLAIVRNETVARRLTFEQTY